MLQRSQPYRVAVYSLTTCVVFLLILAKPRVTAGDDTADSNRPALGFTAPAYFLHDRAFVWVPNHPWHDDGRATTRTEMYFDKVVMEPTGDGSDALKFAVEALPDKAGYELCHRQDSECWDAEIGVREDSGLLFVRMDREVNFATESNVNRYSIRQSMYDYPRQRMELSTEDTASGLKVYRDVAVNPPAGAPDCRDYPDLDEERYECLYTREQLPANLPPTPAALQDGLPDVVQPAENYKLVFAEEFNGVPTQNPAESCLNGMATLDPALWNYDGNPCDFVDANGVPCVNIEDGHFSMSITSSCNAERNHYLNTAGKFAYKYGYLETKYTVNFDAYRNWHDASLVLGDAKRPFFRLLGRYDITLNSYEDLLTKVQTEVDIFEYLPKAVREMAHQYINWAPAVHNEDVVPRRTSKSTTYCGFSAAAGFRVSPSTGCDRATDEVTVTRAVEWTPRGYRTFIKVDGVHDELIPYPKEHVEVHHLRWDASSMEFLDGRENRGTYTGTERDQFFEVGDDGMYLEQVGVAHLPQSPWIKFFGDGAFKEPSNGTIRTKMKIDYIRVFQPEDGYEDMEPLYQ